MWSEYLVFSVCMSLMTNESLWASVLSSVKEEYCSGHPSPTSASSPRALLSLSLLVSNMAGDGVLLKLASHLLSGNESSVGWPKDWIPLFIHSSRPKRWQKYYWFLSPGVGGGWGGGLSGSWPFTTSLLFLPFCKSTPQPAPPYPSNTFPFCLNSSVSFYCLQQQKLWWLKQPTWLCCKD